MEKKTTVKTYSSQDPSEYCHADKDAQMDTAVPAEVAVAAFIHGLWKGFTVTQAEKPGIAQPHWHCSTIDMT